MKIQSKERVYKYFKDYRLVKLCFGILTAYLVWEEFFNFFFVKPTYSSVTKSKLGKFVKKSSLESSLLRDR